MRSERGQMQVGTGKLPVADSNEPEPPADFEELTGELLSTIEQPALHVEVDVAALFQAGMAPKAIIELVAGLNDVLHPTS